MKLGEEILVEGAFNNGGVAWSLDTGWSIVFEKAQYVSQGIEYNALVQVLANSPLAVGKKFRITFSLTEFTNVQGPVLIDVGENGQVFSFYSAQDVVQDIEITEDIVNQTLRIRSVDSCKIDNVSFVEILEDKVLQFSFNLVEKVASNKSIVSKNEFDSSIK